MMIVTSNADITDITMFTSRRFRKLACSTVYIRDEQYIIVREKFDVILVVLRCYESWIGAREND
jgi:hypothetical protein